MRRLARILLNAATGVSVASFIGILAWRLITPPTRRLAGFFTTGIGPPTPKYSEDYGPWPWDQFLFVALLMPLFWLAWRGAEMARTRAERRIGRCSTCGYDLRATPGRCPECGLEPTAKSLSLTSRALEHYGHKNDPGGPQDRKIPTTVTNGPPAANIIQDGRDR